MLNINELTIGQAKELACIFQTSKSEQETPAVFEKFKGKYVIARTRNAGIIFGKVVEYGHNYIHMIEARRIFRPISKDKSLSWYEGVAKTGLCEKQGKISSAEERLIVEDYELTVCSDIGAKSLKEFHTNETTC